MNGHTADVKGLAWSPDGSKLAAGGFGDAGGIHTRPGEVFVWNTENRKKELDLKGHSCSVMCVAWSPDGSKIASGSADRSVILWDASSGERVRTLCGHSDSVMAVGWSPDGRRLVSGSCDKTVRVWDAASGEAAGELRGHGSWVMGAAWSPDGRRLASASADRTVAVWDAERGAEVRAATRSSPLHTSSSPLPFPHPATLVVSFSPSE